MDIFWNQHYLRWIGNGESFLFSIQPKMAIFHSTGKVGWWPDVWSVSVLIFRRWNRKWPILLKPKMFNFWSTHLMSVPGRELPNADNRAPCNGWPGRWTQICLYILRLRNKTLRRQATLAWSLMLIWARADPAGTSIPFYASRWQRLVLIFFEFSLSSLQYSLMCVFF